MAYKVYIIDPTDASDWYELDTEDIDMTHNFAVADVADISVRMDNLTKNLNFKDTPANNKAFGNLFHINREVNYSFDNRLGFNYSAQRKVDCLIFEDGQLVVKGFLTIPQLSIDSNNNTVYNAVVTGSYINFRQILSERQLDVLDMSDLKHQYEWNTVRDSWDVRTQRWNAATSGYTFSPFVKGSGYVYPFADYGFLFHDLAENADINRIPFQNFRPAIYVKEYFDRIFSQPDLEGYTYEVKGTPDLIDKFNSLVIPTNTDRISNKSNSIYAQAQSNFPASYAWGFQDFGGQGDDAFSTRAITMETFTGNTSLLGTYGDIHGLPHTAWIVNRTFVTTGYVKLNIDNYRNLSNATQRLTLELCERDFISPSDPDYNNPDSWTPIGSKGFLIPPYSYATPNTLLEFVMPEREFRKNSILMLRLRIHANGSIMAAEQFLGGFYRWNVSQAMLRLPGAAGALVTFDVDYGDEMVPSPVQGIKQVDFVKSVMQMMNLYVYATKERPKHLVFETYDDYYALTSPLYLASTSLDWTQKIDRTAQLKVKTNLQIPRKYLFTLKDEDKDFLNKNYKTNYTQVYGQFQFDDSYGVTPEKKVEVIFSPSPLTQYVGSKRIHPVFYAVESGQKKPVTTNIRILYYNGLKASNAYKVSKDTIQGDSLNLVDVATGLTAYPQVGNYRYQPGLSNMTPQEDLYFGLAKEVYFPKDPAVDTCPTAYTLYYSGQTTDLVNPNVLYVECEAYLNELDIANLDLRVPVYIDFGRIGHGYWKVLNVDYKNNKDTAILQLQKIAY